MTTEQFDQLIVEIRALKAAVLTLKAAPTPAKSPATAPAAAAGDVPMPDQIIEGAEEIQVHFGKNKGVRLGTLSPKSQEWYAKDPEPRLRNDGTPFPPRAEDVLLRNAARTLVHQRRGTLAPAPAKPITLEAQGNDLDDGSVPF